MIKRISLWIALAVTFLTTVKLSAEQFGPFSYESLGPEVMIYQCSQDAVGDVVIPSTIAGKPVTWIDSYAFDGCTGITSVTIPESATNFYGYIQFSGCTGLISIVVAPGNPYYASADGVLFDAGKTKLIRCPEGKTGDYTIPGGVTSIGDSAFENCTNLTSVTIPESVTEMSVSVFSGCTGLTSIVAAPGNPNYTSTDGVVFNAEMTRLVKFPNGRSGEYAIPDGIIEIGSNAFFDCGGLTFVNIPGSVTEIGSSAFSGCTGLTSVAIPMGVTEIGSSAFSRCTGLTSVAIPLGVTEIGSSAFFGCTGLTSVAIPMGVTEIGSSAFSGCIGLTSVAIPMGITEIGSSAFSRCTGLTSVAIPMGVTFIGELAFNGCTGLTSISIPKSVASMGRTPFSGCTSLTSIVVVSGNSIYASADGVLFNAELTILITFPAGKVGDYTIPEGVTSIEDNAFKDCTGLISVTIPESVTDIRSSTFDNCAGLTSIVVMPGHPNFASADGVLFNAEMTTLITFPDGKAGDYNILKSVTSIGANAFDDCTGLTSVTIPESVTSIGGNAFGGCTGLSSVTIPGSVTYIGSSAFLSCTGLRAVVLLGASPELEFLVRHDAWWYPLPPPPWIPQVINVFDGTAPDFTIHYLSTRSGFTSPSWQGYPAVRIEVDLQQFIDEATFGIEFLAEGHGLQFGAEASTDLVNWSTDGVVLSGIDGDGRRTASVTRDLERRFIRLTAE